MRKPDLCLRIIIYGHPTVGTLSLSQGLRLSRSFNKGRCIHVDKNMHKICCIQLTFPRHILINMDDASTYVRMIIRTFIYIGRWYNPTLDRRPCQFSHIEKLSPENAFIYIYEISILI